MWDEIRSTKIQPMADLNSEYYLRFSALDVPGVLAKITSTLSQYKISISSFYQHVQDEGKVVPIVIFTHRAKESNIRKALQRIDRLNVIKAKTNYIRVEN